MKKKIRDITIEDMPKCWAKLFLINAGFMVLFTFDKDKFDYAKSTIPDEFLDMEIDLED